MPAPPSDVYIFEKGFGTDYKKSAGNQIQKNFNGLQFRNRADAVHSAKPIVAKALHICEFRAVLKCFKRDHLSYAETRYYKSVYASKSRIHYRQSPSVAEMNFQKKSTTFL